MKTMQKGGPIKKKLLASDSNNAKYLFDKNGNKTTKEQYFNTLKTLGKKPIKKMELGGTTTKRIIKKSTGGMYGIPQENLGTSGQYGFAQKGGATKKMQSGGMIPRCPGPNCPKRLKTGLIKAIKKVVKKITRPLRKAQNGIEMDDNMMINKPGYSGGYSKGAVSEVPVTPVRPRIDSGPIPAPDYNSSPGKSGRPGINIGKPGIRKPSFRPSMGKPTVKDWLEAKKKYGYVEPTSREKPVSGYKKGGSTKAAKFAALAPPYNKATFADRIAGAKKSAGSKKLPKAQLGGLLKLAIRTTKPLAKTLKPIAKKIVSKSKTTATKKFNYPKDKVKSMFPRVAKDIKKFNSVTDPKKLFERKTIKEQMKQWDKAAELKQQKKYPVLKNKN